MIVAFSVAEVFPTAVAGPVVAVGWIGVVSTVKVRVAGVASRLPARSIASTLKVYMPASSGPNQSAGESQRTKSGTTPSSAHSNVAASSAENVNAGFLSRVTPVGPPSIVVSGGSVSTVKVRVAGFGSALPAVSTARTRNV